MRAHGTRACYVFGPEPGGDRTKGCRCEPCRDANRAYARARDRASRRPDEELPPAYIDAAEVRAHLKWLATRGVGLRAVAAASGVCRSSLSKLKAGTIRRCRQSTADRILCVGGIDAKPNALVDAAPTWRLIDDLRAHGHTKRALARALGQTGPGLQLGRHQITARNARAVKELHQSWMPVEVLARRRQMKIERQRYRDLERERAS